MYCFEFPHEAKISHKDQWDFIQEVVAEGRGKSEWYMNQSLMQVWYRVDFYDKEDMITYKMRFG